MTEKKEKKKGNSVQVVLTVLLVGAAFAIGSMWTELRVLKNGKPAAKQEAAAPERKEETMELTDEEWRELLAVEGISSGSDEATITLVEFTDYLCSWCKKHHDEVSEMINKEFIETGKIRHFLIDLTIFDRNDVLAAESVRCADEQGKTEEYRDKLFENQLIWGKEETPEKNFSQYAVEIELNTNQFNSCVNTRKFKEIVAANELIANKMGFNSTPGFVLNKKKIMGFKTLEVFKAILDQELN